MTSEIETILSNFESAIKSEITKKHDKINNTLCCYLQQLIEIKNMIYYWRNYQWMLWNQQQQYYFYYYHNYDPTKYNQNNTSTRKNSRANTRYNSCGADIIVEPIKNCHNKEQELEQKSELISGPKSKSKSEPELAPELVPELAPKLEPELVPEPELVLEPELVFVLEPEPKLESELEPVLEPEPKLITKSDPVLTPESKLEKNQVSVPESSTQLVSKFEPVLEPVLEPEPKLIIKPDSVLTPESKLEKNQVSVPESSTQLVSKSESKLKPNLESKIYSNIVTSNKSASDPETEYIIPKKTKKNTKILLQTASVYSNINNKINVIKINKKTQQVRKTSQLNNNKRKCARVLNIPLNNFEPETKVINIKILEDIDSFLSLVISPRKKYKIIIEIEITDEIHGTYETICSNLSMINLLLSNNTNGKNATSNISISANIYANIFINNVYSMFFGEILSSLSESNVTDYMIIFDKSQNYTLHFLIPDILKITDTVSTSNVIIIHKTYTNEIYTKTIIKDWFYDTCDEIKRKITIISFDKIESKITRDDVSKIMYNYTENNAHIILRHTDDDKFYCFSQSPTNSEVNYSLFSTLSNNNYNFITAIEIKKINLCNQNNIVTALDKCIYLRILSIGLTSDPQLNKNIIKIINNKKYITNVILYLPVVYCRYSLVQYFDLSVPSLIIGTAESCIDYDFILPYITKTKIESVHFGKLCISHIDYDKEYFVEQIANTMPHSKYKYTLSAPMITPVQV
jgi:hypothetical protein